MDERDLGQLAIPLCGLCSFEAECVADIGRWTLSQIGNVGDLAEGGKVVVVVVDAERCSRCASLLAECLGWSSPRFRC